MSAPNQLLARVDALRDKSIQRNAENRAQVAQDRQNAWIEIQQSAPDHAAFMQAISKAFGKPAGARVVIDGKVVVDTLPREVLAGGSATPGCLVMGTKKPAT